MKEIHKKLHYAVIATYDPFNFDKSYKWDLFQYNDTILTMAEFSSQR